jgi:hypothetical protein
MKICASVVEMIKRSARTDSRGSALGDVEGGASNLAVAEHQAVAAPRVRIGNLNVVSIARGNFEVLEEVNELVAVSDLHEAVDVVEVGADVDVAFVFLSKMSEAQSTALLSALVR